MIEEREKAVEEGRGEELREAIREGGYTRELWEGEGGRQEEVERAREGGREAGR